MYLAVSRLVCIGDTYTVKMTIDINSEVYPVAIGDKLKVALASTLRLDGKAGELGFDQTGLVRREIQCDLSEQTSRREYAVVACLFSCWLA